MIPGLAAFSAALLQHAGAVKSTPLGAASPVDVTALALALSLVLVPLSLVGRRFALAPSLALPLAGCGALWLWWVLAAVWSPWAAGAAERLPEVALAGPVMLLLGLAIGAEPAVLRRFGVAVVAVGAFVAASLTWGLANDAVVLGGEVGADPSRLRVAYQVAGLAVGTAAGVAGVRAATARGWVARLAWLGVAAALLLAALLPGGRAAFGAAALSLALAPALLLALSGRARLAAAWLLAAGAVAGAALLLVLADPGRAEGLATLERLRRGAGEGPEARHLLWAEAWRHAGWLGLGPGGFPPAAGVGQDRGMHPHNHALEALVEGGVVGLALWLLAFGGGAAVFLARAGRVAPWRAATVLALVLPVAITAMVSTDLGNRMAWLSLGLAMSLALEPLDG